MSWTNERVEILTKMWAEGNSASQIAKELGGVTRNAVIGKVHRLGLSNRATTSTSNKSESKTKSSPKSSSKAQQKARKINAAEPKPNNVTSLRRQIIPAGQPLPPQPSANEISPEALARVSEIEKQAKKLSLLELTERTCKWPVGDPATEEFWFCGLATQSGKPYCEAHVGVAFQPMNSRRDRRKS
jgi:GcrA cell cycle regulator